MKVFSIVLCFALFLVLSAQVYINYTSKSTATNKIGDSDDKLSKWPLPCLTFCPTPGFKTGIQRLVLNSFIACAGFWLFLLKSLHALQNTFAIYYFGGIFFGKKFNVTESLVERKCFKLRCTWLYLNCAVDSNI